MNYREEQMKIRGENRTWKPITSRNGDAKNVSQLQLGQKFIFDNALEIIKDVRAWIDVGCSKIHREALKNYFFDDDFLLKKITETFLLLSSSTSVNKARIGKPISRHKSINTIESKITSGLGFDLTWRFVEVIVEASKHFEVEKLGKTEANQTNVRYKCLLDEAIVERLTLEAHKAFFPEPLTHKPIDWHIVDGQAVGGYSTYQYDLIRTNSFKVDYTKYSQSIFDAVNYIQSVPWRVNKEVLEALALDLTLPNKSDYVVSEYPKNIGTRWEVDLKAEDLDLPEEEVNGIVECRRIFTDKAELYNAEVKDYESDLGKYRAIKLAIGIAESYMDEPEIYFPHSYDFRGRVYPIPVGLSPQGSDGVKAILEYANGEVLTEAGEAWAWAYLASLYGEDKLDFKDRIELGKKLIDTSYKEADEPYQFLAHQIELKKFLKDKNYLFKGRVHLDACNSGSQFTSTMTGDVDGCKATNVIPTYRDGKQVRQDAYLLVANRALELTISTMDSITCEEEKDRLNQLKIILENNGRKLCKKPVMVSNYGGTAGGRAEIVWDMLRELKLDRKYITKKNAFLYAQILGDSIAGVLNGGKLFEGYIHKMNNIIAKGNCAVTWNTSDGFHVVHMKKKELKPKQVRLLLPGARRPTLILKKMFSDDVSSAKMKSAISPNYVHSLDAELLRRTALRCQEVGIIDTDWIHDSFGCHPNHVDRLLKITKTVYRNIMIARPLEALHEELMDQIEETKETNKMLSKVELPMNPEFKEHNYGLVMKSDWFFS